MASGNPKPPVEPTSCLDPLCQLTYVFHVEHDQNDLGDFLLRSAQGLRVTLHPETVRHFLAYLAELKKWNRAINLTAIENDEEIVVKHFIDSLAGFQAIDAKGDVQLLDLGAGAGFPAIPLKLARPEIFLFIMNN